MTELDEEWDKEFNPKKEDNGKRQQKTKKNKISIKKYSGNGREQLHESVIIGSTPKFVSLNQNNEPEFKTEINAQEGETFIPSDTIYTQNPFPYTFDSEKDFKDYLDLAKSQDFDSLFTIVESEFKKYVNVEPHYYTLLIGDTIWSYFQDRFGYTHYVIIVGDNDSDKNSALSVYRYLGYRVYYITSASAANYYTVLGNREEGQVTTAEDEADDILEDKDKINVIKTGYATGGSVPKVELEGGRRSDSWLTFCHKWFAMEEIPDNRKMKGILDRSLVLKFVTGDVPYNIKDIIRTANDPEFEPLYNKLIHVRKLLFCFRLLHHKDQILNVKINVKNRTAELVKPMIRLFNRSPLIRQRVLDDLSKFVNERNKNKRDSFEAELYYGVTQLLEERKKMINENQLTQEQVNILGTHKFSNESIRFQCKIEMDGRDIDGKDTAFYSTEFGMVSQKKITSILKSKFKVDSPKLYRIADEVIRCVEFKQTYLDRIKSYYDIPHQIKIVAEQEGQKFVTDVTNLPIRGDIDTPNYNGVNVLKNLNYEKSIINRLVLYNNSAST